MTGKPRGKNRGRVKLAFVLIALTGIAFIALLSKQQGLIFTADPDDSKLNFERTWRYALTRFGATLPGTPDLDNLPRRLQDAGLTEGAPIFMRVFKREFEVELWMKRGDRFHLFTTYPICRYSGWLGPKLKTGDKQAPEGIYTVDAKQLNPNSRWHRSFNLGYPNQFDREHDRTGSFLMVHGGCSSIGCYAMTNDVITEIWQLVTAALNGGQRRFQVQVFPFRMTEQALALRKNHRWAGFWRQLKRGHDLFEETKIPPRTSICRKTYVFLPGRSGSDGSSKVRKSCRGVKDLVKM